MYTFTLYQLSPIQQGIQAGHAAIDLVRRYCPQNDDLDDLPSRKRKWAQIVHWMKDCKTMILLNGGDAENLLTILRTVSSTEFPHSIFHEDVSLNFIATSIAVLLPESVWGVVDEVKKKGGAAINFIPITEHVGTHKMINLLLDSHLAR